MKYHIEGSVVDTDKSTHSYSDEGHKGGYGRITKRLYRTRRGRWYVETWHSWAVDGQQLDYAEWVSPEEAVRFLMTQAQTRMSEEQVTATHPDLAEAVAAICE